MKYSNPNRIYKHNSKLEGRDLHREKVRVRDNHTCQDCKKKWEIGKRRFDVHHLNGLCGKKSKGYDYKTELDGLITLCHKCHYNRPEHKQKVKIKPFCSVCEIRIDSEYHKLHPCA